MREIPAKLLGAVSDATIGTAIVIVHALLAERARARQALVAARRAR
jgi:hypothetical protein